MPEFTKPWHGAWARGTESAQELALNTGASALRMAYTIFHDDVCILFDHHQIITSEGLLTESFYPGKQVLPGFDDAICAELFDLFPALQDSCGAGYGELVRMPLRSYEARAMMA